MKVVEKITLIIYSNIILVMAVIACLLVLGWLDIDVVQSLIKTLVISGVSSKIILGVSLVFILLSIRCIFFDPVSQKEIKDKQGVLLANENGKLMISKETIGNLVEVVTKEYKMAKDVTSRVELDKDNNVIISYNDPDGSYTLNIVCKMAEGIDIPENSENAKVVIIGTLRDFKYKNYG